VVGIPGVWRRCGAGSQRLGRPGGLVLDVEKNVAALTSFPDAPAVILAAQVLSIGLPAVVAWLATRLLHLRARLARARRDLADISADRDGLLAELAQTRERLAESRQAAGRAQAAAAELEVRFKPRPQIERQFGESRCETANRVIVEALRDRPQ